MPESLISCFSACFLVIFQWETCIFSIFQVLAPSWAPRAFRGRFWMPKTLKNSTIWEPKIGLCWFILRWYFEHGFKMFFGRHLDHFGEPIERLLVTFWDQFSNVHAREGFSDFWYPSEAFCLFLWVWVVGNSSQKHIKTNKNHVEHLLRLEIIF